MRFSQQTPSSLLFLLHVMNPTATNSNAYSEEPVTWNPMMPPPAVQTVYRSYQGFGVGLLCFGFFGLYVNPKQD